MNYVELIERINAELEESGVHTIYTLITNNVSIDTIEKLMLNNTMEYRKLTAQEKKGFQNYLKILKAESNLITLF